MPDIGQLRQRVIWQSRTSVSKPSKAEEVFTPQGTYWASVEPLRGAELYNAAQLKAYNAFRIRMRQVGPIRPGDRLLFEGSGRVFSVVSAYRENERNAYLIITANELTS